VVKILKSKTKRFRLFAIIRVDDDKQPQTFGFYFLKFLIF